MHCKYLNARFECNDIIIFIYVQYCNSGENGLMTGGKNQMSHEVLITRRQSILFLQIQAEAGLSIQNQQAPDSTDLLRPASVWICKKIEMLCLLVTCISWYF